MREMVPTPRKFHAVNSKDQDKENSCIANPTSQSLLLAIRKHSSRIPLPSSANNACKPMAPGEWISSRVPLRSLNSSASQLDNSQLTVTNVEHRTLIKINHKIGHDKPLPCLPEMPKITVCSPNKLKNTHVDASGVPDLPDNSNPNLPAPPTSVSPFVASQKIQKDDLTRCDEQLSTTSAETPVNFSLPKPNASRIKGAKKVMRSRAVSMSVHSSHEESTIDIEVIPRVSLSSDPGIPLIKQTKSPLQNAVDPSFRVKRLSTCPQSLNFGPTLRISNEAQRFIMGNGKPKLEQESAEIISDSTFNLRNFITSNVSMLNSTGQENLFSREADSHNHLLRNIKSSPEFTDKAIEMDDEQHKLESPSERPQALDFQTSFPIEPFPRPDRPLRNSSLRPKTKGCTPSSGVPETSWMSSSTYNALTDPIKPSLSAPTRMAVTDTALIGENATVSFAEFHPGRRLPTPDPTIVSNRSQASARSMNTIESQHQNHKPQSKSGAVMHNIRGLFKKRAIEQISNQCSSSALEHHDCQKCRPIRPDSGKARSGNTRELSQVAPVQQNWLNQHPQSQIKNEIAAKPVASLDRSDTTASISHAIPAVMTLMQEAADAPPGLEKNKLLSLSQVMVDAITSARNAEKAMYKAQQAAHEAEICYDLTKMSVSEALRILSQAEFEL